MFNQRAMSKSNCSDVRASIPFTQALPLKYYVIYIHKMRLFEIICSFSLQIIMKNINIIYSQLLADVLHAGRHGIYGSPVGLLKKKLEIFLLANASKINEHAHYCIQFYIKQHQFFDTASFFFSPQIFNNSINIRH